MPKYTKDSLYRKMLLWFLFVILLPSSVFGVFLYGEQVAKRQKVAIEDRLAILRAIRESISANTTVVESSMEALSCDDDIQKLLSGKLKSAYQVTIAQLYGVQEKLAQADVPFSSLGMRTILFSESDAVPESYWRVLHVETTRNADDYIAFSESGEAGCWVGLAPVYPTQSVIYSDNNQTMLCYYRGVYTLKGTRIGALKCGVSAERFFSAIDIPEYDGDIAIYQQGKLVLGKGGAETLDAQYDPQATTQILGGDMLITLSLDPLPMQLVMRLDYQSILRSSLFSGLSFLLAVLGSGAFLLITTRAFLRSVQNRLNQAVRLAEQVRGEGQTVLFPEEEEDEMGRLISAFNVLLTKLQRNSDEILAHERAEKRALRLALQYQINPHFLFNSLNWLQMSVELDTSRDQVSDGITLLGKLLRYNLDDSPYATLADEIASTDNYIRFMNMRKHQLIELAFDTDALPQDMPLLRFLFQPLCENAIQHGLCPGTPLRIRIRGYEKDGFVFFVVENDGVAIEPDRLSKLRDEVIAAQDGHGVGLQNIAARIRLQYGETSGLTIDSEDGVTRVTLRMRIRADKDAISTEKEGT